MKGAGVTPSITNWPQTKALEVSNTTARNRINKHHLSQGTKQFFLLNIWQGTQQNCGSMAKHRSECPLWLRRERCSSYCFLPGSKDIILCFWAETKIYGWNNNKLQIRWEWPKIRELRIFLSAFYFIILSLDNYTWSYYTPSMSLCQKIGWQWPTILHTMFLGTLLIFLRIEGGVPSVCALSAQLHLLGGPTFCSQHLRTKTRRGQTPELLILPQWNNMGNDAPLWDCEINSNAMLWHSSKTLSVSISTCVFRKGDPKKCKYLKHVCMLYACRANSSLCWQPLLPTKIEELHVCAERRSNSQGIAAHTACTASFAESGRGLLG